MKNIIKQLLYMCIFAILIYAGLYGLTFLVYKPLKMDYIDTKLARESIYKTHQRLLVLNLYKLFSNTNKMIFVGSSNVLEGFRPKELNNNISNFQVHNLAIGSANIHQDREIIQTIFQIIPANKLKKSIFVVGLWYGDFIHNGVRFPAGKTDFGIEIDRYGTYKVNGEDCKPTIPLQFMQIASIGLRPVVLVLTGKDIVKSKIKDLIAKKPAKEIDTESDSAIKARVVGYFKNQFNYIGTDLKNEQFDELVKLCFLIEKSESKLILLDMPLSKWLKTNSVYFNQYQEKMDSLLCSVKDLKNVYYINLQNLDNEKYFIDHVHPNSSGAERWSRMVVDTLRNKYDLF